MSILKKFIRSLSQIIKARPASSKKSLLKKRSSKKRVSQDKAALKKKRFFTREENPRPKAAVQKQEAVPLGEITHFFSRIQVVVVKISKGEIAIGDRLHIKGKTTDFIQKVKSLQIESVDVKKVRRGQLVGLKVDRQAKPGDKVFKVVSS